jgi:hypothetical protein
MVEGAGRLVRQWQGKTGMNTWEKRIEMEQAEMGKGD